jgi:hypothetical protein
MPSDRAVAWSTAQETQSLRDTVTTYRAGAAALATQVTTLRAEVARLQSALLADRVSRGVETVEIALVLDEYAPDLVQAVLVAEFDGVLPARVLEDAVLVACELTAGCVRRGAVVPDADAILRVEYSDACLRVSMQHATPLHGDADVAAEQRRLTGLDLSIVEHLCARWGSDLASSGSETVWAELAVAVPVPASAT